MVSEQSPRFRWWRHLISNPRELQRSFPPHALDAITAAVKACESRHSGEIRFAVEEALPLSELLRGTSARERAIRLFCELRVWDTEYNNGVLIYVLLAEHDVEIVTDRGVGASKVPQEEWEACCHVMERHFRQGDFRGGAIAGVEAVAEVLSRHAPTRERPAGNELPDRPALL